MITDVEILINPDAFTRTGPTKPNGMVPVMSDKMFIVRWIEDGVPKRASFVNRESAMKVFKEKSEANRT